MITKTRPTTAPMIPVPPTLGGGLMMVFRCGGPRPGTCSVPGCNGHPVAKCKFRLLDGSGRTCGKDVCEKHVGKKGLGDGMCLSHVRFVERRLG